MFKFKNNKGSILAYTLVMISIVSIILTASLKVVVSNMNYGINRESKEESLQIAEAGIYFYRWYLAHKVEGLTKSQVNQFWSSGGAYGVGSNYEVDFEGVGKYSISVTPPESNSTIVTVESTGWTYKYPTMQRTVRARFRQPSWSEFSVLCDSDIRFGAGTDVNGPIHSNGGIRFDGVAHNVVSSSLSDYDDPDHGGGNEFGVHTHVAPVDPLPPNAVPSRTDVFEVGRVFPVATQEFDGVLSDMANMKSEAGCGNVGSYCAQDSIVSANGIYFNNSDNGRHIILENDGTMDVSRVLTFDENTGYDPVNGGGSNSITSESSFDNYALPDGGVVFVEDNVWVEGQINGKKMTIVASDMSGGSDRNVFIGNDILYTNYNGTDIIGLIAQGNVEIIRDSEDNLRIDGALLAQNGRVGREHYGNWLGRYCTAWWWGWCTNWEDDVRDTITTNGSIATRQRYGFAYTDNTGYTNRNLVYDNNLLYYPPPYFPTGTNYAIDQWEEI